MARPTTKTDLLTASTNDYQKLMDLLATMSPTEKTAPFLFEDRDREVRDVLIHLYEWHQLVLNWIKSNQAGKTQPFLPAPYNWRTYTKLNEEFWTKHQQTSYQTAVDWLAESHQQVMALIEPLSNQELFEKKQFTWTGTTTLGSYIVSSTTSHYQWAMKKIRKHLRLVRQKE